jgi:hypothetical protein
MTCMTLAEKAIVCFKGLGGDSQNFLRKFVRFFLTLSLKILILLRLKVVFDADIIKR